MTGRIPARTYSRQAALRRTGRGRVGGPGVGTVIFSAAPWALTVLADRDLPGALSAGRAGAAAGNFVGQAPTSTTASTVRRVTVAPEQINLRGTSAWFNIRQPCATLFGPVLSGDWHGTSDIRSTSLFVA